MAKRDAETNETVGAALFARYAEEDLDRWRRLVGGEAVHSDPRWGIGRVVDVRWGAAGGYTASYLQVRVRYADHGTVIYRAASFGAHHRTVTVPAEVRRVIRACFEEEADEAERVAILERHTRELREARDREMLERSEALRQRAADRCSAGARRVGNSTGRAR